MMADRIRNSLLGAMILGVAVLASGCTAVPDPVEKAPPPRLEHEAEAGPGAEPQPTLRQARMKLEVKKSAPVVNLHVPETTKNPALEEYALQLEIQAKKDGSDETGAIRVLFEQHLLDRGLRLAAPGTTGHAAAQVLIRLNLKAWKVMELGAGRVQVHGDGDVAVDRRSDGRPLYRAPLSAESGADLTEARATRQVLDRMCTTAADLVHEKVSEYAVETRVKVVSLSTESGEVDLDAWCDAIEGAIGDEEGVVLADLIKDPADSSATFTLWLARDYEGDLASLLEKRLEQSGTDNRTEVEVNTNR